MKLSQHLLLTQVQRCSESLTTDAQERVAVINSSVNIEQRILNFYGMVEELLGRLQTCSVNIAMYKVRYHLLHVDFLCHKS